ncbi:putative mitochondrial protein [Cucumis melo var. makuwa]|uniref:Putative mitochondrial protein n=1 Tax=Cucumis melo var. makuwa TaxID=1194695 RepID=A0A5D3CID2_CUCMM|nr:putative mitochondrial protein [Cucumis melo var. makuwa]
MAAWTVVAMTTMEKSVALMTAAIAGVEARLEKNLGYLALIGFCQWRLAFFSHLLGKCMRRRKPIVEVLKLGAVVLGTFAIIWLPYLHSVDALLQTPISLSLQYGRNKEYGKEQVHRMFEVCMQFFRVEQKAESVINYFMRLKKITVELALLLPFSPDVKVQQAQREKMAMILSLVSFALKALRMVYLFLNPVVLSLARTITLEHLERWMIASTCDILEASVTISVDEYAKFQNYQDSLQASSSSTPVASIVAPGNTKCFLTSSTKWVIDFGATAHMTGNSCLFSRPLSPAPFPSVTLADGSTSSVLGSGIIHLTPSFSLSSDRVTKKIIGRGYESGGFISLIPKYRKLWRVLSFLLPLKFIVVLYSCADTPSQNGGAERKSILFCLMLLFLEDTPFTSSPSSLCQGEDDNLFIYEITSPLMRLLLARCILESTPDILHHNLQTHVLHQCLLHHAIRDQVMIFPLLFAKVNPDGTVARLKARLVAKGYAQIYDIDYSNTFYLVAKLTSIRLFLSMAATHHWYLHQLDIKNAFLHGDLQEKVYMEQPPGKFSQALVRFGMQKSTYDHSVFYRRSDNGIVLLVVYVDDIVITENDLSGISSPKTFIQGKLRAKPSGTPMMPNQQLVKEGKLCKDPERYRRLVGKLNYLTVTRPDIAYSVSVVSQFMSFPTVDHWAVVEQILCYLKAAPGCGILCKDHGHTRVECFSDADWAGSREDRRSTFGYCVFVGGNLVSWKSKKQNVVSCLSAESKYRAMTQSVCEIVWIHQLLSEIGFSITVPAKLQCDNQAALHIASNPVFHERTKHIEVDCHFIREKIQDGLVSTGYVKTGEQLGDILTKAVN